MQIFGHLRRVIFAGIVLLSATFAQPVSAAPETVTIKADQRDLTLSVWRPEAPKAVIIFSHGGNGAPAAYEKLLESWKAAGFLVVAPLHTDSFKHPGPDHGLQSAFPIRIADFAAAEAWANEAAPGLPHAAAGHSYGSLTAMIGGGALDSMVHAKSRQIKAVIAFSSPGTIPGLINPASFSTLDVPLLMVTGDGDVVPGFAADWKAHLLPFEAAPAGAKYAWIGTGVTHGLAGRDPAEDAALSNVVRLSLAFLDAYVVGNPAAIDALKSWNQSGAAVLRTR